MPVIHSTASLKLSVVSGGIYVKPTKSPTLSEGFLSRRAPHPFACGVARLLHGMMIPNVVTHGHPDKGQGSTQENIQMTLSAPMGKRLVAVTLAPGEVISFNLAYLVAFTKSLKLWTDIDFSWSSFGTDRNFIQNAKGPGSLGFEMNGVETTSSESNFRFNPNRLVAWTPTIGFTFCGIGTIWDVYLNELMIKTTTSSEGAVVLLDSDADVANNAPGRVRNLLKIIKRVYIPF